MEIQQNKRTSSSQWKDTLRIKKHVIGVYPQVGNRHSKKKPNSLDETLSPNFSWLDPSFGVLKSHGLAGKSLFYDIYPPVN